MGPLKRKQLLQYGGAAALCIGVTYGVFWLLGVQLLKAVPAVAAQYTTDETVLRMVDNLRHVTVRPPVWWAVMAGLMLLGGGVLLCRLWRRQPRRTGRAVLLGLACLVFLLAAALFSLWMSRINSIPLRTMAAILWRYLSGGALL